MHAVPFLERSCSQMRRTIQPCSRNVFVTSRSRRLFAVSFFSQKSRLLTGILECRGHPCQKHPSTKTRTRSRRKEKSGLPNSGACRRQPVMPCARKSLASASSVSLLPRPRMRDMTCDRLALVKTSGIRTSAERGGEFQPSFGFLRHVDEHPVAKPGPLCIARI